ncbi:MULTISPECIES: YgaP family membrane protein [Paenibacillus]|uniref:YgaP family membrane protein n=1 Tax=Paenibacillus TaxID=44249 RepID=UPI001D163E14|nr:MULTISPECIES: DUF2892 domain-containing protein [Paenibacillus]MBE9914788.1 DUF2892 domain-containing protein [Paenibacillus donghaensis]
MSINTGQTDFLDKGWCPPLNCNVGKTEQAIRISIGATIVLAGLYYKSWWGLIGLAPIITGATRYCPANAILGLQNCNGKRSLN